MKSIQLKNKMTLRRSNKALFGFEVHFCVLVGRFGCFGFIASWPFLLPGVHDLEGCLIHLAAATPASPTQPNPPALDATPPTRCPSRLTQGASEGPAGREGGRGQGAASGSVGGGRAGGLAGQAAWRALAVAGSGERHLDPLQSSAGATRSRWSREGMGQQGSVFIGLCRESHTQGRRVAPVLFRKRTSGVFLPPSSAGPAQPRDISASGLEAENAPSLAQQSQDQRPCSASRGACDGLPGMGDRKGGRWEP